MAVTVIGNDKGGPGKTALTEIIAAGLAQKKRKVLCVDFDAQGNLTRRMGYDEEIIKGNPAKGIPARITMAEVVRDASPDLLRACLLPCQWDEPWSDLISLAPARSTLTARVAEAGEPGAFLRLRRALRPLLAEADDVLIDTPPGIGHIFHLAAAAADGIILATEPSYDSMRGAMRMQELIEDEEMRENLSLRCTITGVIINRHRSGVADEDEHIKRARARWGTLVIDPVLTLRAPIAGALDRADAPADGDNPDVRKLVTDAGAAYADRIIARAA